MIDVRPQVSAATPGEAPVPFSGLTVFSPSFTPPDLRVFEGDVVDTFGNLIEFLGHGIVEVPVQMQHALVDQHTRDGQFLGHRGSAPGPRLGLGRLGLPYRLTDQRKLLGRRGVSPARPLLLVSAAHACILTKRH